MADLAVVGGVFTGRWTAPPFPINEDLSGTDTTCPQPGCGTDLAVNPFVLHPPS